MKVPFFNYPAVFKNLQKQYERSFSEVASRGAFIEGNECRDFEKALSNFTGARFAVGVANGTDALTIALRAAGIGPGHEVIFCSHTFVATASAIYFAGATPVPVEAGPDHLIDPNSVRKALTPKTKAIVPTQLNGRACDMDSLLQLASEHGLLIIEDSAQGLGSRYKGKQAGTFGLAGALSFYPAKTLGCLGDGGAILTNDENLYRQVLLLKDHGRNDRGEVVAWGFNSRLDNLQAAFLSAKLQTYEKIIAERRRFATMYQELLGGISELILPPPPGADPNHFDVYQNYEIEADRRDDLKTFLTARGIGTSIQWGGKAVHQFSGLNFAEHLPFTEKLFTRMLLLPMHNALTDADVSYVGKSICEFYRG